MRINRKTTIRHPKRLLTGAINNTQLFLSFEANIFFTTRKIDVPAQGEPTTVRQPAENTANASQRGSAPRVQVTWESLGTHSYAALTAGQT